MSAMEGLQEIKMNEGQRLQVWHGPDGELRARLRGRVEVHCPRGKVHSSEKIDVSWDGLGSASTEMLEAALNGDTLMAEVFAHGLRMEWARTWRDPCDDVPRNLRRTKRRA